MSKYTVQQQAVETLLTWVKTGQVAIPEMQRPFVWDSTKVRDLLTRSTTVPHRVPHHMQSADVGLKDGSKSRPSDRSSSTTAAHHRDDSRVGRRACRRQELQAQAHHDQLQSDHREVRHAHPRHEKDPAWISDVAEFVSATSTFSATKAYMEANPDADVAHIEQSLHRLSPLSRPRWASHPAEDLDIETVTEIFFESTPRRAYR